LSIGTKPASVNRFAMLHCFQSPSDTHDEAAVAGGVVTAEPTVTTESARRAGVALGAGD
jgi:hypothetical protein